VALAKLNILDARKAPYSYTYVEGKSYYERLSEKPETLKTLTRTLTKQEATPPVLGMFPFSSPERGRGRYGATFRCRCRWLQRLISSCDSGRNEQRARSKMVLQDLPQVLETASQEEIPRIEKMMYDSFVPQPLKSKLPSVFENASAC
jgi:hypothetical protein